MKLTANHNLLMRGLGSLCVAGLCLLMPNAARAADHGDAPTVAHDQGADIADLYFFLDPTDNTQAVLIATFHGFIVPGEASNFGIFDPAIRYHFDVYNDHVNLAPADVNVKKIKPNQAIDVTFSQRVAAPASDTASGKEIFKVPQPQTASVQFTGFDGIKSKDKFTATALNPSLNATPPDQSTAITDLKDANNTNIGVKFFAGEVDDPFFFDIPAFSRYITSVRKGPPNASVFSRARDSFAGYNVLTIALRMPAAMLQGSNGTQVGLTFQTQRHLVQMPTKTGEVKGVGVFKTVDREGVPAVNVVLVPFNLKNAFNAATPKDDAQGKFAGPDGIVGTLTALGTDAAHIAILASVAVTPYGDMLRLETDMVKKPNTHTGAGGGGNNAGNGFPNGRRLMDDVVDILLFLITNEAYADGDNVDSSDILPNNAFPFVAPAQQPRETLLGLPPDATDDNTQN